MEHVVVGGKSDLSEKQIETAIINNKLSKNGLYSLIDGLRGENISAESIGNTAHRIKEYEQNISTLAQAKLFGDSGGYSFIKGDLAPHNLDLACSLYHSYQRLEADNFDYIFTLDIPLSLKYDEFNTKKNVYEYNRKSLEQTLKNIANNPMLVDKIFFIYQFKTIGHYEIWKRLEEELSLKEALKYKAIGGMVSLKEGAGISIAPFVATAFQTLWDYENCRFNGEELRLHFLGINVAYDRFIIAFLERLFQQYLGSKIQVYFTYDTIKFKRSAMYEQEHICEFDGANLQVHRPLTIPSSLYSQIYGNQVSMIEKAKICLETKAKGQRSKEQSMVLLSPMTISSELAIDRFFEHIIKKHHLLNILLETKNVMWFKYEMRQELHAAFEGYHKVFGKKMVDSIMDSLVHVYRLHRWYINQHDAESLDSLSRHFIESAINFPFRLN